MALQLDRVAHATRAGRNKFSCTALCPLNRIEGTTVRKGKAPRTADKDGPVIHGAGDLTTVTVASYNLELRNKDGFIGDRANKHAFHDRVETWRKRARW